MEQAATLGVAAETALQGLRDWGGLQAGQRVLVNGASGGVGSFAVQLAKALGASHVTAVCSTGNVEAARAGGADRVVDYTREDVRELGDTFDLFFDNAGSLGLRDCRRTARAGGTYVMVTSPKSGGCTRCRGCSACRSSSRSGRGVRLRSRSPHAAGPISSSSSAGRRAGSSVP